MTNTELCSKCGKTKEEHYYHKKDETFWCLGDYNIVILPLQEFTPQQNICKLCGKTKEEHIISPRKKNLWCNDKLDNLDKYNPKSHDNSKGEKS